MTNEIPSEPQRHGEMDVSRQLRTYHGFLIGPRYVVLAHIAAGSFIVLSFFTSAGVGVGLFVAFVELVIGLYFAKDRRQVSWQSKVASLIVTTTAESGDYSIEGRLATDVGDEDARSIGARALPHHHHSQARAA
jgi:hypothetical protein